MENNNDLKIVFEINSILSGKGPLSVIDYKRIGSLVLKLSNEPSSIRHLHGLENKLNAFSSNSAIIDFDSFAKWNDLQECNSDVESSAIVLRKKLNFVIAFNQQRPEQVKALLEIRLLMMHYDGIEIGKSLFLELKDAILSSIESFIKNPRSFDGELKSAFKNLELLTGKLKASNSEENTYDFIKKKLVLIEMQLNQLSFSYLVNHMTLDESLNELIRMKVAIEMFLAEDSPEADHRIDEIFKLAKIDDFVLQKHLDKLIFKELSIFKKLTSDVDYQKVFSMENINARHLLSYLLDCINDSLLIPENADFIHIEVFFNQIKNSLSTEKSCLIESIFKCFILELRNPQISFENSNCKDALIFYLGKLQDKCHFINKILNRTDNFNIEEKSIKDALLVKFLDVRLKLFAFFDKTDQNICYYKNITTTAFQQLISMIQSKEIMALKVRKETLVDLKYIIKDVENEQKLKSLKQKAYLLNLYLNQLCCSLFTSTYKTLDLMLSLKLNMEELIIYSKILYKYRPSTNYLLNILASMSDSCKDVLIEEAESPFLSDDFKDYLVMFSNFICLARNDEYTGVFTSQLTTIAKVAWFLSKEIDKDLPVGKLDENTEQLFSVLLMRNCEANSENLKSEFFFMEQMLKDDMLKSEQRKVQFQHDLKLVKKATDLIDICINDNADLCSTCVDIGIAMEMIQWDESNRHCIRNEHGFYNRHKKANNQENSTGAKINFEVLARLRNLSIDNLTVKSVLEILQNHEDLVKDELKMLKAKLEFVISPSEDNTVGSLNLSFLENIASYLHDIGTLSKLNELLKEYSLSNATPQFNYEDEIICRYHVGYIIVQIGELSKQISKQLKGDFILYFLFQTLYKFRKEIKGHPDLLTGDAVSKQILEQIKALKNIGHPGFTTETFASLLNPYVERCLRIHEIFSDVLLDLSIIIHEIHQNVVSEMNFEKVKNYERINDQNDKYSILSEFETNNFSRLIKVIKTLTDKTKAVNTEFDLVEYKEVLDKLFNLSQDISTLYETGLAKLTLRAINVDLIKEIEMKIEKGKLVKYQDFNYSNYVNKIQILIRLVSYISFITVGTKLKTIRDVHLLLNPDHVKINREEQIAKRKLRKIVKALCYFDAEVSKKTFTLDLLVSAGKTLAGKFEVMKQCFKREDLNQEELTKLYSLACIAGSEEITFKSFVDEIKVATEEKVVDLNANYIKFIRMLHFSRNQINILRDVISKKSDNMFRLNAYKMAVGIVGQCFKELFIEKTFKRYTTLLLKNDEIFNPIAKQTVTTRHKLWHPNINPNEEIQEDTRVSFWAESVNFLAVYYLKAELLDHESAMEKILTEIVKLSSFVEFDEYERAIDFYESNKTLRTYVNNDKIIEGFELKREIAISYFYSLYHLANEKMKDFATACANFLKLFNKRDSSLQRAFYNISLIDPSYLNKVEEHLDVNNIWILLAKEEKCLRENQLDKFLDLDKDIMKRIGDSRSNSSMDLFHAYSNKARFHFVQNSPLEFMCCIKFILDLYVDSKEIIELKQTTLQKAKITLQRWVVENKESEKAELYENAYNECIELEKQFPQLQTSETIYYRCVELGSKVKQNIASEIPVTKELVEEIRSKLECFELYFKYHDDKMSDTIRIQLAFLYEQLFNYPKMFFYIDHLNESLNEEQLADHLFIYQICKLTASCSENSLSYRLCDLLKLNFDVFNSFIEDNELERMTKELTSYLDYCEKRVIASTEFNKDFLQKMFSDLKAYSSDEVKRRISLQKEVSEMTV